VHPRRDSVSDGIDDADDLGPSDDELDPDVVDLDVDVDLDADLEELDPDDPLLGASDEGWDDAAVSPDDPYELEQ
jgi:hypothetical protein